MRIVLNKYLQKLPDCFPADSRLTFYKYYNLCPSCQTELCYMWEFPLRHSAQFFTSTEKPREFLYCAFTCGEKTYEIDYAKVNDSSYRKYISDRYSDCEGGKQVEMLRQLSIEEEMAKEERDRFEEENEYPLCPICHRPLAIPYRDYSSYDSVKDEVKEGNITQEEFDLFFLPREKRLKARTRDKEISFEFLQFRLRRQDDESAQKRYHALISKLDDFMPSGDVDKLRITADPENLKKYIFNLFTLETDIYSTGKRLVDLYISQTVHGRSVLRRNAICEKNIRDQAVSSKNQYKNRLEALKSIQAAGREKVLVERPKEPKRPNAPVLEKPGFFNKKKVLAHNAELTAGYERAMEHFKVDFAVYEEKMKASEAKKLQLIQEAEEKYNQAVAAAEAEVERAKTQMEQENADVELQTQAAIALPSPETVAKQMIDDEITQAEELLKKLLECRNKLYACDVVFGKYRNLVALASFYEYLVTGRCRSLDGADGAYNLFETECRANQIIGRLTKIVDSLEKIKENQYLVYSQLQKINSSLTALNSTASDMVKSLNSIKADAHDTSVYMKTVAQNSEVIAHNTAVNAYYSKMNAELTNSLGYLVALH